MFINDEENGYPVGTFKLNQKIYSIVNKRHMYRFRNKCAYCDSTGFVFIKGKKFECPECHNASRIHEVYEKVIDDKEYKVKSITTFTNNKGSFEIYATDSSGCGLIIQKHYDGSNTYFTNKEEAQAACDAFNKSNAVDIQMDMYKRAEIIGYL